MATRVRMQSHPTAYSVLATSAARKAIERRAIVVTEEAKRLAPVDSGALRDSIHYTITGSGANAKARIGSNLHYTEAVEKGTGIYGPTGQPVRPRVQQFMVFRWLGRQWVMKSVKGRKATPFLRPALRTRRY